MSSIHITSQNNTSEGERRLFTYVHWTKITLSHVNILWWKTNTHRHAHQEKKQFYFTFIWLRSCVLVFMGPGALLQVWSTSFRLQTIFLFLFLSLIYVPPKRHTHSPTPHSLAGDTYHNVQEKHGSSPKKKCHNNNNSKQSPSTQENKYISHTIHIHTPIHSHTEETICFRCVPEFFFCFLIPLAVERNWKSSVKDPAPTTTVVAETRHEYKLKTEIGKSFIWSRDTLCFLGWRCRCRCQLSTSTLRRVKSSRVAYSFRFVVDSVCVCVCVSRSHPELSRTSS